MIAGVFDGGDFGVVRSGLGVKASAYHGITAHDDAAHQRIGVGASRGASC
jgi:hypothetical protein